MSAWPLLRRVSGIGGLYPQVRRLDDVVMFPRLRRISNREILGSLPDSQIVPVGEPPSFALALRRSAIMSPFASGLTAEEVASKGAATADRRLVVAAFLAFELGASPKLSALKSGRDCPITLLQFGP